MTFNAKAFGKIGLAVAKVMVPQIATVEEAVTAIKSGPDKKAAVLNTVASSIELAEVLSGKEIANVPLLMEGIGDLNDALVKILNALPKEAQP